MNEKRRFSLGERFYLSQRQAIGSCYGDNPNKRRKRMPWTDESKQEAIDAYVAADPTPENSMEIVKQIADDMGESANGVRMILTKAKVYIKKAPTSGGASAGGDKPATTRVSKEDAQNALKAAIIDAGQEVDEDIIVKLTGKAAVYLTGVISNSNTTEQ